MSLLYGIYLLTCVEITVLGKVMSNTVELLSRVIAGVAIKLDTGGQVHHQGGQGGDLFQDVLVLLQHGCHISFEKERKVEDKGRNLEIY